MNIPDSVNQGTGDGGFAHKTESERTAAGEVAEAIAGRTDKKDIGFLVKCLGIGFIIICLGACAAFILYGGISVSATAETKAEAKKEGSKEEKGLPPRLEIRKEIINKASDGNAPFSQTIVVPQPPKKQ